LGRVLRADGCRLYRAEESIAAEAASSAPEPLVPRAYHYGRLPALHDDPDKKLPAGCAVLKIGRLTSEGAKKLELRVNAGTPQTAAFMAAHPECGWSEPEAGTFRAPEMSVPLLYELESVLKADGCELYRPEKSGTRKSVSPARSRRHIAEPPVEIVPEGDGYDVVFVDASRGVPAEWLEKQIGVRRENFFRFHVSGDFALTPFEMQKKLAWLGWQSAVRDA
ncbi:MAG: hypothetical protein J6Z30_08690, partial [Pyramidobacter sp.]|nr:hypothetical protein [Pyramidobacter sp.]